LRDRECNEEFPNVALPRDVFHFREFIPVTINEGVHSTASWSKVITGSKVLANISVCDRSTSHGVLANPRQYFSFAIFVQCQMTMRIRGSWCRESVDGMDLISRIRVRTEFAGQMHCFGHILTQRNVRDAYYEIGAGRRMIIAFPDGMTGTPSFSGGSDLELI
jgi:hypothetical protein